MKKLVIPAILTATVLIAGMFAFMPVEKASTVHTTIGEAGGVLSLTKALPDGAEEVTWTFSSDTDAVITSIWVSGEDDFCADNFDIDGVDYRGSDNVLDLCFNQNDEVRDFLRGWEQDINNPLGWGPIPVPAGQDVTLTFHEDDDPGDLTVIISFTGGSGATLT